MNGLHVIHESWLMYVGFVLTVSDLSCHLILGDNQVVRYVSNLIIISNHVELLDEVIVSNYFWFTLVLAVVWAPVPGSQQWKVTSGLPAAGGGLASDKTGTWSVVISCECRDTWSLTANHNTELVTWCFSTNWCLSRFFFLSASTNQPLKVSSTLSC